MNYSPLHLLLFAEQLPFVSFVSPFLATLDINSSHWIIMNSWPFSDSTWPNETWSYNSLSIVSGIIVSCLVGSDSLWSHGLSGAWLLCPGNSLDQNTGVGSHSFSRGSSQSLHPGLSHCKHILYHLSHQGSSFYVGAPSKCCSEHFQENLCLWGCIDADLWI